MMQILSQHSQRLFIALLAIVMLVTRSSHLGNANVFADASWAIFFVAGAFLHQRGVFAGFLALGVLIDVGVTSLGGVSSYCLTPAYWMMIPTYAALWFCGRVYAKRPKQFGNSLLTGFVWVSVAAFTAEMISSGSFYVWNHPTPQSFFEQELRYLPEMWSVMLTDVIVLCVIMRALPYLEARLPRSSSSV
jgi:hypothetical protein